MHIVLALTVAGNVILCLFLLNNGYFNRYYWLTLSAIYSVLADPILQQIHASAHGVYDDALTISQFICVFFNLMIIFFTPDRRVRTPTEIQLAVEFVAFLARRGEFLWTSYWLRCGLAVTNLIVIVYFIWIFRRDREFAKLS